MRRLCASLAPRRRQRSPCPADADPPDLLATVTPEPPAAPGGGRPAPLPAARPTARPRQRREHAAVDSPRPRRSCGTFYQRFYGVTAEVTPRPKELAHATALLTTHGEAKAHFLLTFAHQAAAETHYQPQVFGRHSPLHRPGPGGV